MLLHSSSGSGPKLLSPMPYSSSNSQFCWLHSLPLSRTQPLPPMATHAGQSRHRFFPARCVSSLPGPIRLCLNLVRYRHSSARTKTQLHLVAHKAPSSLLTSPHLLMTLPLTFPSSLPILRPLDVHCHAPHPGTLSPLHPHGSHSHSFPSRLQGHRTREAFPKHWV